VPHILRQLRGTGDCAGGTVAALGCVRLRDDAPEMLRRVRLMIYASTDLGVWVAAMREKGHGFGLQAANRRVVSGLAASAVPSSAE
jgi:hypothetical protein